MNCAPTKATKPNIHMVLMDVQNHADLVRKEGDVVWKSESLEAYARGVIQRRAPGTSLLTVFVTDDPFLLRHRVSMEAKFGLVILNQDEYVEREAFMKGCNTLPGVIGMG